MPFIAFLCLIIFYYKINFTDNIGIIPFIYRNITDSIVNHGKTKNQCHISLFYERIIQE